MELVLTMPWYFWPILALGVGLAFYFMQKPCPVCGSKSWSSHHLLFGVYCSVCEKFLSYREYNKLPSKRKRTPNKCSTNLAQALETIRDGFDCDPDAHTYGTMCRRCLAEAVLESKIVELNDDSVVLPNGHVSFKTLVDYDEWSK